MPGAPRTDPSVRHSRTGLLPRVRRTSAVLLGRWYTPTPLVAASLLVLQVMDGRRYTPLAVSTFRLRARLGFSISILLWISVQHLFRWPTSPWSRPFPPPSPPVTAYRALCSTASSVLWSCPTPCAGHRCRVPLGFTARTLVPPKASHRVSRFPLNEFTCMHRVLDHAGPFRLLRNETSVLPYELNDTLSTPKFQIFRGSIPSLPVPLSTLRCALTERQRMTRGQCGSLLLSL